MNLRTLKKLSKRASPLLGQLGDNREQFRSEKGEGCISILIADRKHWRRGQCYPAYEGRNDWSSPRGAQRLFTTRAGRTMVMSPPYSPPKGTIMVGAMSGYYEPEWDEESAWEALETIVRDHFTDWDEDGPTPLRTFRTPADILRGARDIIGHKSTGVRS